MTEPVKITYKVIMDLLKNRHSNDFFVPECKDGQTMGRSHNRLDAWVMKRSYSKWCLSGYEIKMTRSDFLRDDKYVNYLACCNILWFVAPAGVIDPKELPEEVGLLCPASTGSKLMTKKKAPIRSIESPVRLYEYLLMSRCRVRDEHEEFKVRAVNTREEAFEAYLRGERGLESISYHLADKVGREIRELRLRADDAEKRAGRDAEVRERIIELGFRPEQSVAKWQIDQAVRDRGLLVVGAASDAMKVLIAQLQRSLEGFETKAKTIQARGDSHED